MSHSWTLLVLSQTPNEHGSIQGWALTIIIFIYLWNVDWRCSFSGIGHWLYPLLYPNLSLKCTLGDFTPGLYWSLAMAQSSLCGLLKYISDYNKISCAETVNVLYDSIKRECTTANNRSWIRLALLTCCLVTNLNTCLSSVDFCPYCMYHEVKSMTMHAFM